MTRKSMIMLAAGVVAALGITGTALASDDDTSTRQGTAPANAVAGASTAPKDAAGSDSTGEIGPEQAAEIALDWTGGGRVTEIEREWEHGRPVWDVEIVKDGVEHELDVDRESGQVVKAEQESADDWDDDGDDDRGDDEED